MLARPPFPPCCSPLSAEAAAAAVAGAPAVALAAAAADRRHLALAVEAAVSAPDPSGDRFAPSDVVLGVRVLGVRAVRRRGQTGQSGAERRARGGLPRGRGQRAPLGRLELVLGGRRGAVEGRARHGRRGAGVGLEGADGGLDGRARGLGGALDRLEQGRAARPASCPASPPPPGPGGGGGGGGDGGDEDADGDADEAGAEEAAAAAGAEAGARVGGRCFFENEGSTSVHCQPSSITSVLGGVPPSLRVLTPSSRMEADTRE